MLEFFHDTLYVPIYNALVYLVGVVPGGDGGLAVIALTLIVKLVTMPLALSALKTQRAMKQIEPELKKLREEYKDDKEKQAREMLELYKKHNIKPFASLLTIIIQIPILIALFFVFQNEALSQINVELLYSFVAVPAVVSTTFLGVFSIVGSNLVLAIIAAATQFVHAWIAIPVPKKGGTSMQEEFGRAMALQARMILPLIIGAVAFTSGALALYFITSNIVTILQELLVVRRMRLRNALSHATPTF